MRVVFRKFGGVRFEVFGGAAQQRPGLTAQAPLQLAQGLCACGLVGDAREKRRRSRKIYSVVKLACEPARSFSYSRRPMTGTM